MATLIPFPPTNENYVLPDPRIIASLTSPSVKNKYLAKNQNLFQIDTQRVQPFSIKSYVNIISDSPLDDDDSIPTPPLSESPTKRMVSFNLDYETDEEPVQTPTVVENSNFYGGPPLHLNCLQVSPDILVALGERDVEISELVKKNDPFFATLKAIFHCDAKWKKFEEVLYMKRQDLPDNQWLLQLSDFFTPSPPLWMKFKDIVGYCADDSQQDDSYDDFIDFLWLREHPEKLASLEKLYPQFFEIASTELQDGELFAEFKRILFATHHEMSDAEWDSRLYGMLERYPGLLGHFEDVVSDLQMTDEP